jgi:hypothetical protein
LHRLSEKHDIAETEFLVDADEYLTALSRHDLSGQLDYHDRSHIENGSRPLLCESTAFIRFDGTVTQAQCDGCGGSDTATTEIGRTGR